MQNQIPTFRRNSIISEKLGYLPEKLKTLTSASYHRASYFLLKLWTRFQPNNVYERVFGIFLSLFKFWVINNNVKDLGSISFYKPGLFSLFANKARPKQTKKNPEHAFVNIIK